MPPSENTPGARLIADDLISVPVADAFAAQALAAELRDTGRWREVVAGVDSVVVQFDNAVVDSASATTALAAALVEATAAFELPDTLIEIPVCYGGEFGPDLDAVCERLGISSAEFIRAHTTAEHRVEMLGFTPGFAYVGGLDPELAVPRRRAPRQHVPAGSVGVADQRTGLYALPGPGGWSIIGRTPLPLFEADAEPPFRLAPGMRIRFRAIDAETFGA